MNTNTTVTDSPYSPSRILPPSPITEDHSPSPAANANLSDIGNEEIHPEADLNIECRSGVQIEIPRPATPVNELDARISESDSETIETGAESQPLSRVSIQPVAEEPVEEEDTQPSHQREQISTGNVARLQDDANSLVVLVSDLVHSTNSSILALGTYGDTLRKQVQQYTHKIEKCQKIIEDCQSIVSRARQILEEPVD
jgi:hypothetical protein